MHNIPSFLKSWKQKMDEGRFGCPLPWLVAKCVLGGCNVIKAIVRWRHLWHSKGYSIKQKNANFQLVTFSYWIIRKNKKDDKRKRGSTCSFDQVPKSSTWQILSWRPFPRKNGLPWNNRPSTWRARLSPHIHPHIWPSRCVSFGHVPPKGYWERTHLQMSKTEFYVMGDTKSGENGKNC